MRWKWCVKKKKIQNIVLNTNTLYSKYSTVCIHCQTYRLFRLQEWIFLLTNGILWGIIQRLIYPSKNKELTNGFI